MGQANTIEHDQNAVSGSAHTQIEMMNLYEERMSHRSLTESDTSKDDNDIFQFSETMKDVNQTTTDQ